MATLLTSLHLMHVKMTPGERLFAARLMAKLEDKYYCWFDVPVGKKQLRPDFIVLHPGSGILVLEVKDWKLEAIRQIDAKTVELLTDSGLKHVPNPLEQARAFALEITESLENDPYLVEQENPQYKGRLIFPWGYGLVLTNITRQQFALAQLDRAIPADMVICQDEMKEHVDAMAFQSRLQGMIKYTFGSVLTLSRIDRIRWHLFPEIRIDQGGLFGALSADDGNANPKTSIADAIPDIVEVMDLEQEKFARNLGSGHRMIHGVAGSGKTLILAYRCIHLSRIGLDKPILVLCYNKSLAAQLQALLKKRGAGDNVQVRHFHGWCKDLCDLYQLDLPGEADRPLYDRQVLAVIEGANTGRVPRAQYSAILVDEGHDFEAEWFRLIVQMLDPATDELLLVYDDVQSTHKRKRPMNWASVGIHVHGRCSTISRMNYGNTAELRDVASHFVSDYLDDAQSSEEMPRERPVSGLRCDGPAGIRKFSNTDEEYSFIASWFGMHAAQGVRFERMAVLCRFKNQIEPACAALGRHGIKAGGLGSDGVQVLTMNASRGLHFQCVAIPDLGAMPYEKAPEVDEVRVLYVAMTRATHELMLTHHSDSKFTDRLKAEIDQVKLQEVLGA